MFVKKLSKKILVFEIRKMEAIITIARRDGHEFAEPVVSTKRIKQRKRVPKGVSATGGGREFSKFTPIKTQHTGVPDPWEDDPAEHYASAMTLEREEKTITKDEVYARQDAEWRELVKNAPRLSEDVREHSDTSESDELEVYDMDESCDPDGSHADDSYVDMEDYCVTDDSYATDDSCATACDRDANVFSRRVRRKDKPRVYTGIGVGLDDEFDDV